MAKLSFQIPIGEDGGIEWITLDSGSKKSERIKVELAEQESMGRRFKDRGQVRVFLDGGSPQYVDLSMESQSVLTIPTGVLSGASAVPA